MTRAVLVLIALATCGFGVAFVLRPVEMAGVLHLSLSAPSARIEVRAVYGGMQVGLGVFLLVCAMRRNLLRVGLSAAACVFTGLAVARFFGLMLEGFSQPLMLIVLMLEAMVAVLATWGAATTPGARAAMGPPAGVSTPGGSTSDRTAETPAGPTDLGAPAAATPLFPPVHDEEEEAAPPRPAGPSTP